MSNFSIAHTVTKFDAKKSEALTGQRLAKVRYKSTKNQAAKFPSVCVSVPYISADLINAPETISVLIPYIRIMLENAQDGVIRSLYESRDGSLSQVIDSDISIAACIGYMEAQESGSRLTKEILETWFDTEVSETVQALVIEKLAYTPKDGEELTMEQVAKVDQVTNAYKDLVSSLAGGKTVLQPVQIRNLKGVLELCNESEIGTKLVAKLIVMENKPKMEDMLELM